MININLAKDFSDMPFGMYRSDGKNSGQHFLEDHLLPIVNNTEDTIRIDLRNLKLGISSSFYIAAFSQLVSMINPRTKKLYTTEYLKKRIRYIVDREDEDMIEEIHKVAKNIEVDIINKKAVNTVTNMTESEYSKLKMLSNYTPSKIKVRYNLTDTINRLLGTYKEKKSSMRFIFGLE